MKLRHVILTVSIVFGAQFFGGCGSKEEERARVEKERARLELEEKARREGEVGNKAITDINRRMFGKKPVTPAADEGAKPDEKKPSAQPSAQHPKS